MKFRIADRYQIITLKNGRVFLVDDDIFELEKISDAQRTALISLKNQSYSLEELISNSSESEKEKIKELFKSLLENGILRSDYDRQQYKGTIVQNQINYLDDFVDNANLSQQNLEKSCVAIIGVGGVGSVVLQHLVGAGIKKFILIDPDTIEIDNFNRQFIYKKENIGEFKVDLAKKYIVDMDNNSTVYAYKSVIHSAKDLEILDNHKVDFLVNAADQPKNLPCIIDDYCKAKNIPWISGGVGRHRGFWGPLIVPNKTKCLACHNKEENDFMEDWEKEIRDSSKLKIKASFGATNTIISTFLAKDIILYMSTNSNAISMGRRCTFDFISMSVDFYEKDDLDRRCYCG
ncbi:ThiF family adenylyltransferase [Rummeliibacillus pycnus]|uniref:ThiF family adenylyltransferase n=1 Tax=Rummeliibacillus pycnus TaxID=101070 RepID=UPI0037C51455